MQQSIVVLCLGIIVVSGPRLVPFLSARSRLQVPLKQSEKKLLWHVKHGH